MFQDAINKGTIVIGLKNVMSEKEATERIIEAGIVDKYKK